MLQEASDIAHAIGNERYRSEALVAIALKLPKEQRKHFLQEALDIAHAIREEEDRSHALTPIVPNLPPKQALDIILTIRDKRLRFKALISVAGNCHHNQAILAFAVLDVITGEERKAVLPVLAKLSPALEELGGKKALLETARAIQDVARWWP